MKFNRAVSLLVVVLLLALTAIPVFAQDAEPVTVTIPGFSTSSVVSTGMAVAGSFFTLLLTLFVIRVAPRFVSFIRRSFGAAAGG